MSLPRSVDSAQRLAMGDVDERDECFSQAEGSGLERPCLSDIQRRLAASEGGSALLEW